MSLQRVFYRHKCESVKNKCIKNIILFPCLACLNNFSLPHINTEETSFYEAKNCEQVLARKDSWEQCLICHHLIQVQVPSEVQLLRLGSYLSSPIGLKLGFTFIPEVSDRFYVQQHSNLPNRSKLPLWYYPFSTCPSIVPAISTLHFLPPCCYPFLESRLCSPPLLLLSQTKAL